MDALRTSVRLALRDRRPCLDRRARAPIVESRTLHVEISSLRRRTTASPGSPPATAPPETSPGTHRGRLSLQSLPPDGVRRCARHAPSQPLPRLPLEPTRGRNHRRPLVPLRRRHGAHRHLGAARRRVVARASLRGLRQSPLQPHRGGRQRVRVGVPGGATRRKTGVSAGANRAKTSGRERGRTVRGRVGSRDPRRRACRW